MLSFKRLITSHMSYVSPTSLLPPPLSLLSFFSYLCRRLFLLLSFSCPSSHPFPLSPPFFLLLLVSPTQHILLLYPAFFTHLIEHVPPVLVRNAPYWERPCRIQQSLYMLSLVWYTPKQNTPDGEMCLISKVFIISLNTMSLFFLPWCLLLVFIYVCMTDVNRIFLYSWLKMKK
jgi:hypothetical protein